MTFSRPPYAGLIPGGQSETPGLADAGSRGDRGGCMQVFPTTHAVEVFPNKNDEITIRQEHPLGDEPISIFIPLRHIEAVISALRDAVRQLDEVTGRA